MKKFKKIFKKEYPWFKFYPNGQSEIKVPNISIYELLEENYNNHKDTVALNYFNKKTSFKEFIAQIDLCARALKKSGINEGDVVTICMANTPEAIISFYAVNKIGAISNMLHPLSAEEEIKHSLNSTHSVMMIAINLSYEKIKNIIAETSVHKVVIVSPGDSMPSYLKVGYYLTKGRKVEVPKKSTSNMFFKDFMNLGKTYKENVFIKTTKDQPAVILHSGGTTGVPKNIVLTSGNINAVAKQGEIMLPGLSYEDSILAVLPIFHCFGLVVCIHVQLCLGVTVILIPQFDAKKFDKLLTTYKPTVIAGVPTLYEALMTNKKMDNVDLSYVKYAISGGDTMSGDKQEKLNLFLKKHNCFSHIIQGYGLTETTGPVAFGALGSDVAGSVGVPLPSNLIKIVNIDTHEEATPNEVGEICVSGPTVMMGYLDNEYETNKALEKDKNGNIWIHTGDLGYMSKDGILFFVQRLKRMLIVSGYNVYPSHIEEVIMKHPYVLNCGVIGIPHPYKVQVPKAFIVLKENVKLSGQVRKEIKEYCEKNLSKYMIPKEFEFRESLPKTMIGKVNYRELENEMNSK